MSSFVNEKYVVRSNKTDCFMDTTHDSAGMAHTFLCIRALPESPLLFAYMPQEGLVRVNPNTGAVESNNLLGQLMGIRDGDEETMMQFFRENGFLFPIANDVLEHFPFESIFSVVRRARETLNMMSLLYEPRIQYKKIMSTICWLTLSPRLQLRSMDESKNEFKTCLHSYMRFMDTLYAGHYNALPADPYEYGDIQVADTVYPPQFSVPSEEMMEMEMNNSMGELPTSLLNKYYATLIFVNEKGHNPLDKKVIDYFYHLTREAGNIISISDKGPEVAFDNDNANVVSRLSEQMRSATIDVAKITIKEELDYAINAIYPSYDIDTMTGSWVIPDLYSALLFSLFYLKPDTELYRKCDNPNCGRYFLVRTTNSRRKYCCSACSNAMQQRKHRQKTKKASTGADAKN